MKAERLITRHTCPYDIAEGVALGHVVDVVDVVDVSLHVCHLQVLMSSSQQPTVMLLSGTK